MKKIEINKKLLLGLVALASILGIVIVSSFFPVVFDLNQLSKKEFLTNEVLSLAIVTISMVACMFIGMATNSSVSNSPISIARDKFDKKIEGITNTKHFFKWVSEVMQPSDIKQMNKRLMRENGIDDYSLIDLDRTEIKQLEEKPCEFNGVKYSSLSKEQVQTILDIKDGKHKVTLVDPSYYLTISNKSGSLTPTEKSGKEGTKKGLYTTVNFVSKLVMTLLISSIFAALVKDSIAGGDTAKSWINFASRMFSLCSGAFSGFILGNQINDIDAEFVEMRVIVLDKYLNDKTFKPLTEREMAEKEFNEYQKNGTKEKEMVIQ